MSPLPATMPRVLFAYGRIRGGVVQLEVVSMPLVPAPAAGPASQADAPPSGSTGD